MGSPKPILLLTCALLVTYGCAGDDVVAPTDQTDPGPRAPCVDYGGFLHWVGSVSTPGRALAVAVSGDYSYVADSYRSARVIEIRDPAAPRVVASVETRGQVFDVAVAGDHAYLACSDAGLYIVDISDPTAPQIPGFVDTPAHARSVVVGGDYAYVADGGSGLQVVDVRNPTSPEVVGAIDTPGFARGVTTALGLNR